jgi:hypothetical protein
MWRRGGVTGGWMCLACLPLGHPLPVVAIKMTTVTTGLAPHKKKMLSNGLLLNGLHTLAIQSFVSGLVLFGLSILAESSILLVIQLNQLSFDTPQTYGPAILIAVLLQSISGALLLWTVGEAPALFWSIYIATGSNGDGFGQMLHVLTKLTASASFGGVQWGELLAGKYLDVSNGHIQSFLSQTKEVCNKGEHHLQLFM